MIPDFSGNYLKLESTQDGDIIEIVDEGKMEYSENLKKDMFYVRVKNGDKVMIWSPNNKQGTALQEAFGEDSVNWKGKKCQVMHVEGKMVVRPIKV